MPAAPPVQAVVVAQPVSTPVPVAPVMPAGLESFQVPPGPVGLRFRGTTVYEVLPSSSLKTVVFPGYVLKTVNGRTATAESLLAARGILEINDDGRTPRTLVFSKMERNL